MNCDLVQSYHRDVPLHQEIWYSGRAYRTTFGDEEGTEVEPAAIAFNEIHSVVRSLLASGRGPVLVFVESRRETTNYAAMFSQTRARGTTGIALAEQLDLFSEPTEASEQLRANAERHVTFHSADLSPQERQVIEAGFTESKFEVCFATSTLAAGVNFPFRSVVFPKLTYQYGDRANSHLSRSDYRNMSGRAGRLGMHPEGFAVLLPRTRSELQHATVLVSPANDRLLSQLIHLSLRKSILMLVACRLASNLSEVMHFFQSTLYWYQTLDKNPAKLADLEADSASAFRWLDDHHMIRGIDGSFTITPFGNATSASGLLPATAVQFAELLRTFGHKFEESFDQWSDGLIYAACASPEFWATKPSRYIPYPTGQSYDAVTFWSLKKLPISLDRANLRLAQCAQAVTHYAEGLAERKIAYATKVSSGQVHRLAAEVGWVLDGLHKLACVPEIACPQNVSNRIAMQARRVSWGAPPEALDVIRVAERHRVPGFGRQRAMMLIAQGITTLHDLVATAKDKLTQLLRSDQRAQALLDAAFSTMGYGRDRLAFSHARIAKSLGIEPLLNACEDEIGVRYEEAIIKLLRVENSWIITVLDNGKRQNVPDILIELADTKILMECKTCTKSPQVINKEDAWAVVQKSSDFEEDMKRVTLGKPVFDETSKKKAAASHDITLVEHSAFIEGLLRVHAGTLQPREFLDWLGVPGIAEIDRLAGLPTFAAR
jgi:helicase